MLQFPHPHPCLVCLYVFWLSCFLCRSAHESHWISRRKGKRTLWIPVIWAHWCYESAQDLYPLAAWLRQHTHHPSRFTSIMRFWRKVALDISIHPWRHWNQEQSVPVWERRNQGVESCMQWPNLGCGLPACLRMGSLYQYLNRGL